MQTGAEGISILTLDDTCPSLPILEGEGQARALVWPGTGARHRSMHHVTLPAGARTRRLRHAGEAVYYVRSGSGQVQDTGDGIAEGSMVHIAPDTAYAFAGGEGGLELLGGPCPADPALYAPAAAAAPGMAGPGIRLFHRDHPSLRLPLISRDARFVVWLGVGAETANMNYVVMEPGEANTPHIHDGCEDTIFILEGEGTVRDFDHDRTHPFRAGQAIHVPPNLKHAVAADRGRRIVSVGGPCPADRKLLRLAGVLKD